MARDGRLLGVISARLREAEAGLVAHVDRLQELTERIGMLPPALDVVRFDSIELGWATHHIEDGEISGLHGGRGSVLRSQYDTRLSVIDSGPEIDKSVHRATDWRVAPMLGVTPQLGPLRFNYAFQWDPGEGGDSQHRWYAALAF